MRKKAEQRHNQIAQIVTEYHKVSVSELSEKLGVAPETIRLDLTMLENLGVLYRTHGGAVARDGYADIAMQYRAQRGSDIKRSICSKALEWIKNDDSIFVDPSSTALPLGKMLHARKNILVVTNCLEFVSAVSATSHRILVLGGAYSHSGTRTGGNFAIEMLDSFRFDVAILGMDGCLNMDGPGTQTEDAIAINKHVLRRAKTKILVSRGAKVSQRAKYQYAKFTDIDVFITDEISGDARKMIDGPHIIEVAKKQD